MNPWILVSLATLIAFALRTGPHFSRVFGPFVNFTETDAWAHVRTIEHLAANFPHRLTFDPFARIDGQPVDTGLFFDYPVAFLAWAAHLSTSQLHILAAWYPALLGTALVPVTFLAGRALFGDKAGLWAAATVATLPGHFLHTGSLGFTDHHAMEALLTTTLLWLLARSSGPWPLAATLTAYVLTFAGGAFVVALVTLWYWFLALRTPAQPFPSLSFAIACAAAAPFAFWRFHVYLMVFSLAALLLAAPLLALLPAFSRWCARRRYPRAIYLATSGLTAALALTLVSRRLEGEGFSLALARLVASGSLAPTVAELQPLRSFDALWSQWGPAVFFLLAALLLLAFTLWRRPQPAQTLFLLWSLLFLLMSLNQVRMTYYFGSSAAILAGFLLTRFPLPRTVLAAAGAVLLLPNLYTAATETAPLPGQIPPGWVAALTYLRDRTPAPFPESGAFLHPPAHLARYSILAWWDYGYWIATFAHRVPVTNPTQTNVGPVVDFLLATDTPSALAALNSSRARYVALDYHLPYRVEGNLLRGQFLHIFPYSRDYRSADYVLVLREADGSRSIFFRPRYFATMLFRLTVAQGRARPADESGNFALITYAGNRLRTKQQFTSLTAALAAATACAPTCKLVSENPLTSPTPIDPVLFLRPVFTSSQAEVRVYELP